MVMLMWILVLIQNPDNFNAPYRTPDVLDISIRGFLTETDCLAAKKVMARGYTLGGNDGARFQCVYEQTYLSEKELKGARP